MEPRLTSETFELHSRGRPFGTNGVKTDGDCIHVYLGQMISRNSYHPNVLKNIKVLISGLLSMYSLYSFEYHLQF